MRRDISIIFILAVLFGAMSCSRKAVDDYPMFWSWLTYSPTMNLDSVCQVMNDVGIDGIILESGNPDDYRKAAPIVKKHNLKMYAWYISMNAEHDADSLIAHHPDWFSVNREGRSLADTMAYVGYYKFLCPALPEVREYLCNKAKAICEVDGVDGVSIDYHRFVDVVLPTTLWPKYGIVQDRDYAEWDFGYHPAMIEKFKNEYGYDPRDEDDPTADEKWRQFRCDQITEAANMIADVVHSYGKKMAASPFPTPKMSSRMVRQDWGKWKLDIVFPMVYQDFYTGDPSFVYDCTVENNRDKNPMTTLYCGLMVGKEDGIFKQMDAAFAGGTKGIALFTVNSLRSPEVRARFKEYTDSVKSIKDKAASPKAMAADTNVFAHEGVMNMVQEKMCAIAGSTELSLGDYKLKNSYDATRIYQVTDKTSGKSFDVTFYLYGDVLSGWDVVLSDRRDSIEVKKINVAGNVSASEVPSLMNSKRIPFNRISCQGWAKDYPYRPDVAFRIAHTGNSILLEYKVTEKGTMAAAVEDNGKVWNDSCVEFFVSPTCDDTYYNFESNCTGHVLAEYGKKGTSRKTLPLNRIAAISRYGDYVTSGNKPLEVQQGTHTWELCLVIPAKMFKESGMKTLDGAKMTANFYKCGDKIEKPHYLSWNPVKNETPSFHLPEYFGVLNFE